MTENVMSAAVCFVKIEISTLPFHFIVLFYLNLTRCGCNGLEEEWNVENGKCNGMEERTEDNSNDIGVKNDSLTSKLTRVHMRRK